MDQSLKWIDPLEGISANKTALNTGQKTYKERSLPNGRDWKRQQIDDDNLEVISINAKKKGYDLGGVDIRWQTRSRKRRRTEARAIKPDDQNRRRPGRKEPTMMTRAHSPETEKEGQSASGERTGNRGLRGTARGSIRALEG